MSTAHQPRHQRDHDELRDAGPGQHFADLLGVVALLLRQIERQDERRAVERGAEHEVGGDAEAEIAPEQQAQIDDRIPRRQLDPQEGGERDRGDDRQADDEVGAEPVVLVAFLEHGLQAPSPIAMVTIPAQSPWRSGELHRRLRQRGDSMAIMMRPGTRLT